MWVLQYGEILQVNYFWYQSWCFGDKVGSEPLVLSKQSLKNKNKNLSLVKIQAAPLECNSLRAFIWMAAPLGFVRLIRMELLFKIFAFGSEKVEGLVWDGL